MAGRGAGVAHVALADGAQVLADTQSDRVGARKLREHQRGQHCGVPGARRLAQHADRVERHDEVSHG